MAKQSTNNWNKVNPYKPHVMHQSLSSDEGEWNQRILNENTGIIQTFHRKVTVETNHAQTELNEMRHESTITKITATKRSTTSLWPMIIHTQTNNKLYSKSTIIEKGSEEIQSKEIHSGHTWTSQVVLTQLPVFSPLPGSKNPPSSSTVLVSSLASHYLLSCSPVSRHVVFNHHHGHPWPSTPLVVSMQLVSFQKKPPLPPPSPT